MQIFLKLKKSLFKKKTIFFHHPTRCEKIGNRNCDISSKKRNWSRYIFPYAGLRAGSRDGPINTVTPPSSFVPQSIRKGQEDFTLGKVVYSSAALSESLPCTEWNWRGDLTHYSTIYHYNPTKILWTPSSAQHRKQQKNQTHRCSSAITQILFLDSDRLIRILANPVPDGMYGNSWIVV